MKISLSSRFTVKFIPQCDFKENNPDSKHLGIIVNVDENTDKFTKQNSLTKTKGHLHNDSQEDLFYECFEEQSEPSSPQFHQLETFEQNASKKASLSSYGMFPVASSLAPKYYGKSVNSPPSPKDHKKKTRFSVPGQHRDNNIQSSKSREHKKPLKSSKAPKLEECKTSSQSLIPKDQKSNTQSSIPGEHKKHIQLLTSKEHKKKIQLSPKAKPRDENRWLHSQKSDDRSKKSKQHNSTGLKLRSCLKRSSQKKTCSFKKVRFAERIIICPYNSNGLSVLHSLRKPSDLKKTRRKVETPTENTPSYTSAFFSTGYN